MNKIIIFFKKRPTLKFQIIGWVAIAVVYVSLILMLLNIGGCSSFEKTTGYKQNKYWGS